MASQKVEFKVATTLGEIFKDNGHNFYEVFLKVKNGTKVKRYLAKGYRSNRNELNLCLYSKIGRPIWAWNAYNGTNYVTIPHGACLDESKAEVRFDWTAYVVYTSKQEVFDASMNILRQKKLEINKQILKLQNELYTVE